MLNSGHLINRWAAVTLDSTGLNGGSLEFTQSEYALLSVISAKCTAVSSLVGGLLYLEMFDATINGWMKAPQTISMFSFSGTAPSAVAGNTAGAAMIAGARVVNSNGITNATNLFHVILTAEFLGSRLRLTGIATSGTGTLDISYHGSRPFTD